MKLFELYDKNPEPLDIPRDQMPQITRKDLGDYDTEKLRVPLHCLVPSQQQRVPGLVDQSMEHIEDRGKVKPLIVDRDLRIVNGHHRWDACKQLGMKKVPVIRVNDATLWDLMDKFSHTTSDEFAEADDPKGLGLTTEVYVDMDGVLADFFGEWAKLAGVPSHRDIEDPESALDLIRDADSFWLDLPKTDNADHLLDLVLDTWGSYKILSTPLTGDPNSGPHKLEWVKQNLQGRLPSKVILSHEKQKWATQPDGTPNILIDDYGVNIQKWEAAGGIGFKHKDHKFDRTVRNIQAHSDEPVTEARVPLHKVIEFFKQFHRQYGGDPQRNLWKVSRIADIDYRTLERELHQQIARGSVPSELAFRKDLLAMENFKDGEIKGKSRPGRAKRAGVDCSKSITDLRKMAKNSSGEKQKMAHWCANMKSGRNKKK